MIPGNTALGGIEQALAQVRAAEADANHRLDEVMQKAADAKAAEAEGYQALAAFRLKSDPGLGGRLTGIATRVRAVLALRASDRQTLEARLAAAQKAVADITARRAIITAEITEAEEKRRALENQVQIGLAARDDYAAARRASAQATLVANEADKKAKIAEDELDAKRKPYDSDPLFQYLWKRRYGTSEYKAGNIARLLDGWVAGLCRYGDARPNYAMLTEIPARLREHANASAAKAVEALETVKTMEKAAFDKGGGATADKALADRKARLDETDSARAEAERVLSGVQGELDSFARGEDGRYKEAVGLLADTLRTNDLNRLYNEALATPSPDDEDIVRRIAQNQTVQGQLADQAKAIRGELTDLGRRRNEVSQVAAGFRQRRYDADGSMFDNDVVGHLLRGVITGVITGADYWARMEQGRRWSQPDNWGGGSTWGGGGGGSWGGGGGGGSWGGGGGGGGRDDGDGFTTKGGF